MTVYRLTAIAFCIFLMLLSAVTLPARERRALLVGIGEYPAESEWTLVHGDNDVRIIREFLLGQGVKAECLETVTNEEATKKGILSALERLAKTAGKGDVVYIHFSGHGQQVTDLDGDEEDGFDEAWVPYDARKKYVSRVYEGENHIIDDELNAYLKKLRAKVGPKGRITVVSDACHSGSGSRGLEDDEYFRGTDEKFILPAGAARWSGRSNTVEWLFIGACKSYQTNYECKASDGQFYGCLSYVIAGCDVDLSTAHYSDVLAKWAEAVDRIVRYPQEIDAEGHPRGISAAKPSRSVPEPVEGHRVSSADGNKTDTIF